MLEALRETQTLLSRYAHDLQRDRALHEARDAARNAADHTRRLYREGRLLSRQPDAERTLATAQAALAASQAQLSQDQVDLFLVLGGGWRTSQPPAASRGRRLMDMLHAMRAFVRVVDTGSFTAAARQTDTSTAQVSRPVSELENHLHARRCSAPPGVWR